MNKMNILTKIMFWAPRAKAPKQTRLPHPHTCHITPNQFEVHRSNPVPLLKVITRQTQGIQINEALLSEKTVRNALTWYLTFEFAKTVITDKEWVQATVSWIRQADSGPSFSMSWRTSPDFVVKCADRILAQLSNTEPFAMYQWTTHSIKIVRDRARVIFKRSVSLLDDPKTTYQTACTCPTLGPGVPPPQGPPSMPLPSTLLRSGGPSPPPPPPGFRSTGTPRLIRTSKRPRRRSPLIVRDRNIELGDIPDLPQITGKKVMETLVKTYLKDAGSVV
ncbi:hypothetical protein DL98DRAFT_257367 [Cadophora sp. DSE1049]|nr:hypothetical protein DL98DRAFT_257367 [Cadophora sp. DSE1049]